MRADICDPSDHLGLAHFKEVLQELGSEVVGDWGSSLDVQLIEVRIGNQILRIFVDAWSVDIEGPPELVQHVVASLKEKSM